MALHRNGEAVASGGGAHVLDSPLLAVAHLTGVLARQTRFAPVQAGEIITTGTLTELFPAIAGDVWSTEVSGIALPPMTLQLDAAATDPA
jgi:2-oxo-3-hexenedioate decarboxylase